MKIVAALALTVLIMTTAYARPNEKWAEIQRRADAGDEDAAKRIKFFSLAGELPADPPSGILQAYKANCCGQADAYEADDWEFDADGNTVAVLTCNEPSDCEAIPGKTPIQAGTRIKIPTNKIMTPGKPVNDTGHGWVFLSIRNINGAPVPVVMCYSNGSGQ